MSLQQRQQRRRAAAPITTALLVIGLAVPVALLAGLLYGAVIDDVARGIGVAGAVVMGIAAVVAVLAAMRADGG